MSVTASLRVGRTCAPSSASSPRTVYATDVTTWDSCTGRTADAYEGLNEWDISHPASDTNWTQTDASVQQSLYSTVKAIRPVTVVAPSLTSEAAYAALGSVVAATSTVGNTHVYFAARNPGTPGWGGSDAFGVYGSLGYDLAIARQTTGSKPMYVTETGYGDTANAVYVPPATKARYTMRTLLEAWNTRVARTYMYELVDEGGGYFGSYGLTDGSGNIKPAYAAVKNLLAHLSDPGKPIVLGSLAYTLAAPAQVHHSLFQKRDGSFVLALWLEASEWDPIGNVPIAVLPQAARLTFGRVPSTLRTTSFDDAGNVTTQTLAPAAVLTLDVGGSPTLLDTRRKILEGFVVRDFFRGSLVTAGYNRGSCAYWLSGYVPVSQSSMRSRRLRASSMSSLP